MRSSIQIKIKRVVAGLCGLVAIAIVSISASSCKQDPKIVPIGSGINRRTQFFGMWVWQPQWITEAEEQDKLVAFCKEHGINRLLVQIHLAPDWEKEGIARLLYARQFKQFLSKTSRANIAVEALDGSPEMGNARNHAKVLAVVDALLEFNRTQSTNKRFVGIHYDIEPYATPAWHTDQRHQIMQEYLELFKYVRAKLSRERPRVQLAASIPFWYDQAIKEGNSCLTVFRGERKNFHEHIQDLTDYVAVMSYRRTAVGENSITKLIDSEVQYAYKIGRTACAGMETIALPESPELSFHNMSTTSFWSVKRQIEEYMSDRTGFGGVFVHDYRGFKQLLESDEADVAKEPHGDAAAVTEITSE